MKKSKLHILLLWILLVNSLNFTQASASVLVPTNKEGQVKTAFPAAQNTALGFVSDKYPLASNNAIAIMQNDDPPHQAFLPLIISASSQVSLIITQTTGGTITADPVGPYYLDDEVRTDRST